MGRAKKNSDLPGLSVSMLHFFILRTPLFFSEHLLLSASQHHQKCPDHNTEIGNVEHNIPDLLIFYRKTHIIYHVFPYQTVIGIAVGPAQQKGQSSLKSLTPLTGKGQHEKHRQPQRQSHRKRCHQIASSLSCIQHRAFIMISADQKPAPADCLLLSFLSRPLDMILDQQVKKQNHHCQQ